MRTHEGVLFLGNQGTNEALVCGFLDWCTWARNRSPETVRTYGDTLRAWARWLGATSAREADRSNMQAFVLRTRKRRASGRTGAAATQRREIATLRAFYRWLHEEGIVTENPALALHGPAVRNVNPRPLSDEQWAHLWNADMTGLDRVALGLGFYCGLRRSEVIALRREQVSDTKINHFVRKGATEHTLPWRDMVGILSDWNPQFDSAVFCQALNLGTRGIGPIFEPWPSDPQTFNKRLTRICRDNALPHCTPHQLRHSCATNLLRAGVPLHLVARLLNHSDPQTTMRYVQAGAGELAEWRKHNGY